MPENTISEESIYFIPVETICPSHTVTCPPDLDVIEMARIMKRHDISCIVVTDGLIPLGIVSVRDCRDIIAESSGNIGAIKVRDIMSTKLITVGRKDYLFNAIFKMSTFNIHRLIVVEDDGKLFGVITDTDLVRIKIRTPLYLNQELEAAQSVAELRLISTRLLDMVKFATQTGAEIKSLVQLISHFNDRFTMRIIYLLERDEGVFLPEGAAYLSLGSEGRGEQTLRTDQDSAIVYRDDFPPEKLGEVEHFATRLVELLVEIGVPRCPADTMASNPQWRRSLSEWKGLLDQWITVPTPEHMVDFGMFQDLRVLHGDNSLEQQLRDHIATCVHAHTLFFPNMAKLIMHFPPPLGMFGLIKVERRGENRGKFDIKKAGIFSITVGASLLALEAGKVGGNTWKKLELLGKQGVISMVDLDIIEQSFTFLVELRLRQQLRALAAGAKPTNFINPSLLHDADKSRLKHALRGVNTFLGIIRERYQLDLISR